MVSQSHSSASRSVPIWGTPGGARRQRLGHRLLELLGATINEVEGEDRSIARPAIRDDLRFLRGDNWFTDLFAVLDAIDTGGRYHKLNLMVDGQSAAKHPVDRSDAYAMELSK